MVYTTSRTADGNYEVFQDGARISTGTKDIADSYLARNPGVNAPENAVRTINGAVVDPNTGYVHNPGNNNYSQAPAISSAQVRQNFTQQSTDIQNRLSYYDNPNTPAPSTINTTATDAAAKELRSGNYGDPVTNFYFESAANEIASLNDRIGVLQSMTGADVDLDNRIVTLQQEFVRERDNMARKNTELEKSVDSNLYKFGGYRYQSQAGAVAYRAEVDNGIERIDKLTSEYDTLIEKARQAIQSENAKALNDLHKQLAETRQNMFDAVDSVIKRTREERVAQAEIESKQTAMRKTNQDIMFAEAELVAQGAAEMGVYPDQRELQARGIDPAFFDAYFGERLREINKETLDMANTEDQIRSRGFNDSLAQKKYSLDVAIEQRQRAESDAKRSGDASVVANQLRLIENGMSPSDFKDVENATLTALFSNAEEQYATNPDYRASIDTQVNQTLQAAQKNNFYLADVFDAVASEVASKLKTSVGVAKITKQDIENTIVAAADRGYSGDPTTGEGRVFTLSQAETIRNNAAAIAGNIEKTILSKNGDKSGIPTAIRELGVSLDDPIVEAVYERLVKLNTPEQVRSLLHTQSVQNSIKNTLTPVAR